MSNIDKILNANQDLFTELDDKNAEVISGGAEVFTIENPTQSNVGYSIDGQSSIIKPNEVWDWTAYSGGIINFDQDARTGVESYKEYDLANGRRYAFQYNTLTSDPYDIDLYDMS